MTTKEYYKECGDYYGSEMTKEGKTCDTCGNWRLAEKTDNGFGTCWLIHCCGWAQAIYSYDELTPHPTENPEWVHPHDCGYTVTGRICNCDCDRRTAPNEGAKPCRAK